MAVARNKQKDVEIWMGQLAAVLLPLAEMGAIGYGTYVFVYLVCIRYLLSPSDALQAQGVKMRSATAIGLLVGYFILLLLFFLSYLRLLQVIWTRPGLLPLGDPSLDKTTASTAAITEKYDSYLCDYEGMPLWCDKCSIYKPDRTHHCKELDRCVRRMDHFCPWAGGIISETSHKFFVQFLFYGAGFTAYLMICMAYFLSEHKRLVGSRPATWIGAVAIAAFFFLFTFGMFMQTFWNVSINHTSVELLKRGDTYYIAMLKPVAESPATSTVSSQEGPATYSAPNHADVLREVTPTPSRRFIVIQIQAGDHPWGLAPLQNIKSIMGNNVVDWFLPFRMSPCLDHSDPSSEFAWGQPIREVLRHYYKAYSGEKRTIRS